MNPTRRIIAALAALTFVWCALIVSAPLCQGLVGTNVWSDNVYAFFSPVCHQLDDRSFHILGFKFAVCIRCFSIYAGFLISISALLLRRGVQLRLPESKYLLAALLPMLIDVALDTVGVFRSTSLSRIVTGSLFGLVAPFFIVPPLTQALRQLRIFPFSRGAVLHAGNTE